MAKNLPNSAAKEVAVTQRLTRGERLALPPNPPRSPEAPQPSEQAQRTDQALAERVERVRTGGGA